MPGSRSVSGSMMLVIVAVIVILIAAFYFLGRKQSHTQHGLTSHSAANLPDDFHGIPPEGTGGDPELNREKNRWFAPMSCTDMTVSGVIATEHQYLSAMDKEMRRKWSSEALEQAAKNEARSVRVTGYISHAKESGPEACNGKSDIYRDFHIWITQSPDQDKRDGIIVEAIPYWKEQFPEWRLEAFEKLANEHAQVRVTGWLLWDEEHGDEVGKSRGSLWEVHPFTKFEVFSGGAWHDLSERVQ